MMPKSDTIDAIRRLNFTADPQFLAEFPNDELVRYLARLAGISQSPFDEVQTDADRKDRPPVGAASKQHDHYTQLDRRMSL